MREGAVAHAQAVTAARTDTERRVPFRPDIEGLRAVAVGLVLLYHARVPGLSGGYVGVDVFFVISGFLISNHLVAELTGTGRLRFARFYARRALRILPASFLVLAVTTVACALWLPPLRAPTVTREIVATALYVPNVVLAREGADYLAEAAPSPVQHYWSLGVEEQFYLLWPALLVVGWLVVRHSRRRLGAALGLVTLASFGLGVVALQVSTSWAFFSLPTRAWELGVGGLVAVALPALARRPARGARALALVGLLMIAAAAVTFDARTPFPGVAALLPVTGAALVIAAGARSTAGAAGAFLGSPPAQWLGRLSYSTYLWHWPLLVLVESRRPAPLPLWASVAVVAVSLPLAAATYRLVESPMRRLPLALRHRPGATLLCAAAASALLVLLALGALSWSTARPLSTDDRAADAVLVVPPTFTATVPSNLVPALRAATDDLPTAYADGCHVRQGSAVATHCAYGDTRADRRLVLLGDSHAAQWLPALDDLGRRDGFRVELASRSSCPAAVVRPTGPDGPPCTAWRSAVLDAIDRDPPDVVVVSDSGLTPATGPATEWGAGLVALLAGLPDASRVVVIGTTPAFPWAPATCLSAHLADAGACTLPRDAVVDPRREATERRNAEAHRARYVPAADYLCTSSACGAIIGSTLLYRDEHHLTVEASRAFVPVLAPVVADAFGAATAP